MANVTKQQTKNGGRIDKPINELSCQEKQLLGIALSKNMCKCDFYAYELMVGLHVFCQTDPPRLVDCLAPPPVCHIKMEASH